CGSRCDRDKSLFHLLASLCLNLGVPRQIFQNQPQRIDTIGDTFYIVFRGFFYVEVGKTSKQN
ncbi:hypothetical protein, partial [uncultured Treponema sp.]|uniref:hypothetical protein n=1 Tax=uncultured Treponema sp. TaxID=162155 RepID=UPI0025994474